MNTYLTIILVTFTTLVSCRDFYVGMFKTNDWLVAQDRLYKERVPYKYMYAKYGRIFKCKITYFRIADRLGYGSGPKVKIVRGGLNHKYLVLRLTSAYDMPISVNIYVGCANTFKTIVAINTKAETQNTNKNITTQVGSDTNQSTAATSAIEETTIAPTAAPSATGETTIEPTAA